MNFSLLCLCDLEVDVILELGRDDAGLWVEADFLTPFLFVEEVFVPVEINMPVEEEEEEEEDDDEPPTLFFDFDDFDGLGKGNNSPVDRFLDAVVELDDTDDPMVAVELEDAEVEAKSNPNNDDSGRCVSGNSLCLLISSSAS